MMLTGSQALANDNAETDAIIEDIQKHLDLTNEQLEKLKPIIKEKHEKLKQELNSTIEQGFAEFDKLAEQLKSASSQLEQKANAFLTSEEMTKFREYFNNLDKQSVEDAKQSLINNLNDLLELTQEQTQKIGPILDDSFTQLSELIHSTMTSGGKSLEEFKADLKDLSNQLLDKLNDILSKQQMEKLEEHNNIINEGIQRAVFPTAVSEKSEA